MINETLARVLWPNENSLREIMAPDRDREVIGVVRDVRHLALDEESGPEMYLRLRQATTTLRSSWLFAPENRSRSSGKLASIAYRSRAVAASTVVHKKLEIVRRNTVAEMGVQSL